MPQTIIILQFDTSGRFSEPATAFNVDRPKYRLSTTKSTLGIADAGTSFMSKGQLFVNTTFYSNLNVQNQNFVADMQVNFFQLFVP